VTNDSNPPAPVLEFGAELLRTVVEAAPNAVLLVGVEGRILLVNAQTEAMFGHGRRELLGQPVEMLVPTRFRGQHPLHRSAFFAAPTTRAMGAGRDLFGLRQDGSELPIEIGLNPIHTAEGSFVLAAIIDITQRKRGEALLRASLAEKETLLREVHHRVKNNMQIISSMLSLQTSYVDEPRYRTMFEECQGRVRAMALIHEKLYGAANLTTIELGDYVRDLAVMLIRSYARADRTVRLDIHTGTVKLDIETAIPIGLIVNELVTNSLKHAFPGRGGGTIRIVCQDAAAGQVLLEAADDGVGLPADLDIDRSRTLGLKMIRSLVQQVGGRLEVQRTRGTTFRIRFPAPLARAH